MIEISTFNVQALFTILKARDIVFKYYVFVFLIEIVFWWF